MEQQNKALSSLTTHISQLSNNIYTLQNLRKEGKKKLEEPSIIQNKLSIFKAASLIKEV